MSVLASRQAQVDGALVSANVTRLGRSQFRRALLAEGSSAALTVATAILTDLPLISTAYVWDVLQWVPRVAEHRAAKMMRSAGVSPWAAAGGLTGRQREALAVQLRQRARLAPTPAKPKAGSARSAPAPRHHGNPVCSTCGEHLRRPSEDGLCGFCRDEAAA